MSENKSHVVELIKYPILVFSIVIALVLLKNLLGLQLGALTQVSTAGVELRFAESSEATLQALTELEASINDFRVRIGALEEGINGDSQVTDADAFSAAQTTSETIAKLARLQISAGVPRTDTQRGYVWIGDFDGRWTKITLGNAVSGQPVTIAPTEIQVGSQFSVLGNMVLRGGLPTNDESYYRGQENLGVVPRGERIVIRSRPVGIERNFATQYWAEVELVSNAGAELRSLGATAE